MFRLNLQHDEGHSRHARRPAISAFRDLYGGRARVRSSDIITLMFPPAGGRVSIWTNDETEYILPALLISGLKVRSNGQAAK